jgi:Tfp pilus assembly protein PilN
MERRDINLLPKELVVRRRQQEQKKAVNFLAAAFFVVSLGISTAFFLYLFFLSQSTKSVVAAVSKEEQKIANLRLLEEDARRLEVKSSALYSILKSKKKYSYLLEILAKAAPAGVRVTSLVTAPSGEIQVAGLADSYVILSRFLLNILDPQIGGEIFAAADLNSVNLDERVGGARFLTTFYLKEGSLWLFP